MSHEIEIILTLTVGLSMAFVFGFLARRLGLSPIVGYLVAGVLVGPHTPGFIADKGVSGQFSEIGVILLMFGVGLHFHFKDLIRVARFAVPGAAIQSTLAAAAGAVITQFFGWSLSAGIIFGIGLSVASTVVLTRVLTDHRTLHTSDGHIAVGWLVVEDIFTIIVLVMMPLLFNPLSPSALSPEGLFSIALALLKLLALFLILFLFGKKVITFVFTFAAKVKSRELFTLAVLSLALSIAVGSSLFFGASMALGALLAGMIVGQSEFGTRAATEALPMRDAFSVLFFVSMGMMFDPLSLMGSWEMILIFLGLVILGKPLFALIALLLLRRPFGSALRISAALAQIGEFTFILSTLAISMKIFPETAMNFLVPVAIISIALNPLVYRLAMGLSERFKKSDQRKVQAEENNEPVPDQLGTQMILVGYGPVGQTLHRILKDNGIHTTVVEMNLETVRRLKREGIPSVYGDAEDPETLISAGVTQAQALIVSTPDIPGPMALKNAKELNPQIRIICRSVYLRDLDRIYDSGADAVFSGEGEAALSMTAFLMKDLGSTDEQIDLERERVRRELFHK